MNRRSLIKNALLGLAVSLVPEILRPSVPEVKEEKKEEVVMVEVQFLLFEGNGAYSFGLNKQTRSIELPISTVEKLSNLLDKVEESKG
jgi:hypothetical protein